MRIPTLSNSQSSQEPALCAVVMRREKGRFVYITSSETGKKDDRFFKEAQSIGAAAPPRICLIPLGQASSRVASWGSGSSASSLAPPSSNVTPAPNSADAYSKRFGRKKPCHKWTAKIATSVCAASNSAAYCVQAPVRADATLQRRD
jgi:hypothetical protein